MQDRLAEAELLLREAIAIDRKVLGRIVPTAANRHLRLGIILYNRGELKGSRLNCCVRRCPFSLKPRPLPIPTVDSAKQLSISCSLRRAGPRKRSRSAKSLGHGSGAPNHSHPN